MLNDYGRPVGGAELQMLALRDGLQARGHSVRLLTSDAELVPGQPLLSDRSCRGRTDRLQPAAIIANRDAARAVRTELADFQPDIVHIRMFLWQLSPLVLPILQNVPVLFQAAVYKAICPNGMKLFPDGRSCDVSAGVACLRSGCVSVPTWAAAMGQMALLRRWRRHIDMAAALSPTMAQLFAASGWPVEVLGNGVDEVAMRPRLSDPPRVAYAGRLSREKGIVTLLEGFAAVLEQVPEARLEIAGDGPLKEELEERAAPLGDAVRFLGHLSRPELERRFATAWVQVVPSLWHEPFGNVTPEAMMRGTAVVASQVGGQSDIVRHEETGFLVPPGDAAALATRLEELVTDREAAERMGRAGRQVALTAYSRAAALDRVEAAYDRTIEAHRGKRRFGVQLATAK